MSDSDSDRTVDSDELQEFLGTKAKKKEPIKRTEIKHIQGKNSRELKNVNRKQKRSLKAHDVSDSESDDNEQKAPQKSSPKKLKNSEPIASQKGKPICKYGTMCYRKNPEHLKEFSHSAGPVETYETKPSGSNKMEKQKSNEERSPKLNSESKMFSFYLTKVHGIPKQFNHGIAFDIKDLLSPSRGKLIASAQFNYMTDIPWLIEQYPPEFRKCPLTIVHGEQREAKKSLEKIASKYPNVKLCQAKLEIMYGTHHTKMMLLLYEDGFKIIIHTANLVEGDWFQKTQGIWISPLFPPLDKRTPDISGESSTGFKKDFIEYLSSYNAKELDEWIEHVVKHNLSTAKVFLIGSIPGRHVGSKKTSFGHLKLRKVLYNHGPTKELVNSKWPLIGQFSSIGSLGSNPDQWLCGEWLMSLATVKGISLELQSSSLKLVYPTVENVRKSLEGYPAGASLPYSIKVATKQPYLKGFLHQWKSSILGRSEASPHIKTYLRLSPDAEKIAWFLVTSANLSKAAWGALEKKGTQLMIRSYELGVLFMPSEFGTSNTFSVHNASSKTNSFSFPVPYDIPVTPYGNTDQPWIWDIPQIQAPDRNGNKWCPPL